MLRVYCQPSYCETSEASPLVPSGQDDPSQQAICQAMRLLEQHPHFSGRTSSIELDCDGKRLVIRGRVPSFYLKQVLQEALARIDEIETIDNRVEVVSSSGLSSATSR